MGLNSPDFHDPDLVSFVELAPPGTVHALPFGAIRLNHEGNVVFYSDAERRLSGYRKDAVSHSFFSEIAPCMNNPDFRGRIDKALQAGKLNITFSYIGDFEDPARQLDVRVQSATGGGCWIFIRRS